MSAHGMSEANATDASASEPLSEVDLRSVLLRYLSLDAVFEVETQLAAREAKARADAGEQIAERKARLTGVTR